MKLYAQHGAAQGDKTRSGITVPLLVSLSFPRVFIEIYLTIFIVFRISRSSSFSC